MNIYESQPMDRRVDIEPELFHGLMNDEELVQIQLLIHDVLLRNDMTTDENTYYDLEIEGALARD